MRRLLFVIASVIVSVISLFVVLQNVPLEGVLDSIQQAKPAWLIITFISIAISMFVRGIRWWGLLGFRLKVMHASHIMNITFLGNQLPLRMGEVFRSVLAIQGGVPVITSATSIVVERLVDMLVVVLMISAAIARLPDVPAQVAQSASLFGVLAVIGFLILLFFAHNPKLAHRILEAIIKLIPILNRLPLVTMLEHVLDGLQPLTQARILAFTAFWTLISWFFSLISFYFLFLALDIQTNYWLAVPLGIGLASLSIALPVSVAGLGPFEAAIFAMGQLLGMSNVDAVSLGFLLHGMSVLSYVFWGIIALLVLGVSPSAMVKQKENDS